MTDVRVEIPYKPWNHQRAAHVLRAANRFLVLVWHRRAGKTVFAVLELLMAALATKQKRARYGYVAPLQKQAKAVAWDYLKHFARAIPGTIVNETELQIELPNGARLKLYGADNPDGLRGIYFDGIVIDEVADIRPQLWGEIIRPALADRQGWAIFIGTPKGQNLFSELYYRAELEPGWKADLRRASTTGVIPDAEIEQARREMSGPQFAQEMECDFAAASENVLLRLDDVMSASKRIIGERGYCDEVKILGVDVARFGDDQSCILLRQGRAVFRPRVLRNLDTMQLADQVVMTILEHKPDATFIDVTGIGAGVVDRLKQLGHSIMGVDFGSSATESARFQNKRVEMWWRAAEWLRAGGCIPDDEALRSELVAPTYWFDANGRMCLEAKKDIKARGLPSPDRADALVLTFAMPVAHKGFKNSATAGTAFKARTEYETYQEV